MLRLEELQITAERREKEQQREEVTTEQERESTTGDQHVDDATTRPTETALHVTTDVARPWEHGQELQKPQEDTEMERAAGQATDMSGHQREGDTQTATSHGDVPSLPFTTQFLHDEPTLPPTPPSTTEHVAAPTTALDSHETATNLEIDDITCSQDFTPRTDATTTTFEENALFFQYFPFPTDVLTTTTLDERATATNTQIHDNMRFQDCSPRTDATNTPERDEWFPPPGLSHPPVFSPVSYGHDPVPARQEAQDEQESVARDFHSHTAVATTIPIFSPSPTPVLIVNYNQTASHYPPADSEQRATINPVTVAAVHGPIALFYVVANASCISAPTITSLFATIITFAFSAPQINLTSFHVASNLVRRRV